MTTSTEITDLFARLAVHLKIPNDTSFPPRTSKEDLDDAALDLSISELNQSLNPNGDSRVRVLDTVLSLMCFKAPKVRSSLKLGVLMNKQMLDFGNFSSVYLCSVV